MRLYLCGPVSLGGTCTPEQEAANVERFHEAKRALVVAGYDVESPTEIGAFLYETRFDKLMADECPGGGLERWYWYMRRTVIQMLTCDGVATLKRVEESRGCIKEISIAIDFGLPVKPYGQWL